MATPKCPYFGRCGGCSFQNLDYEIQLENKRNALASAAGFEDIKVFSGKPYFYRNRMDFAFHPGGIGFREKGKWWKIIDVERCVISEERLNKLLMEARIFFENPDSFDLKTHAGTLRYAVIRTAETTAISFVLNSSSARIKESVEKIRKFSEKTSADNILVAYVPPDSDLSTSTDYFVVKGTGTLKEKHLGKTFWYSATVYQPDTASQ